MGFAIPWSPLLPSSPSHLSGSSQWTSPNHPVSCIEPVLAFCFTHDNILASVPISQTIPSSPSPTESKRPFYTSVSLDEGEGGEWKSWLKLNIKKTKIMVSNPITSWQIEREKVEVTDYLLLGSKITVDGNCRHEIRKWLLLGRKAKKNLDSVLKIRDITLPTKVCYNQDYGLPSSPIWLWELDSKEGRKPTK